MHDERAVPDAEACEEVVAGQEEIYLEATEEELRAELTCEPTIAEKLQRNLEKMELDWDLEISDDRCE